MKLGTLDIKKAYLGTLELTSTNAFIGTTALVEGSGLPDEYQQVEYLQGGRDNDSYIDTGFIPTDQTRVLLDGQALTVSALGWLYGCRTSGGFLYTLAPNPNLNQWIFGYNKNIGNGACPNIAPDTNRHVFDANKGQFYVDGVFDGSIVGTTYTCDYNMWLFKSNGTGQTQALSAVRIYSMKIWNNNTLVRNFIPCYRKSDNEPGMYDTVNSVFYTNVGTGTFIVGSDI